MYSVVERPVPQPHEGDAELSAEVYSVRDKIRDIAGELALDEQATGLTCPYCAGGSSGEKSLSVIRKANKAEYFCHRASCNMHGAVNMAARIRLRNL